MVGDILKTYDVRAAHADQPIGTLSGGNQQKALLGRWLGREPEVILLDEPTRGVDVGAKAQIHAVIDRLAAAGKGVLLISSDLTELIGMSDRILVMNRGQISAELSGEKKTEHNVILAASGLYAE
jgi:ribose transport system ATP-binding protein